MRSRLVRNEKRLHWVASAKRDLLQFPGRVMDQMGYALGVAVYVLHAFQKKSPSGVRTAQQDVALISERLKAAKRHYEASYGKEAG